MRDESNEFKKIISEGAVLEEQANIVDDSLATQEEKAIAAGSLKKHLEDSKDKTSIAIESVYRWAILFLFRFACLAVMYVGIKLSSLITAYVDYVKEDPEQLKELLKDAWKVLSGAAIVIFGQFLGWAIKNRRN